MVVGCRDLYCVISKVNFQNFHYRLSLLKTTVTVGVVGRIKVLSKATWEQDRLYFQMRTTEGRVGASGKLILQILML